MITEDKRKKYDWNEVQKFYDEGHSLDACAIKFGMCSASFQKAKNRGVFKARSPQESLKIYYAHNSRKKVSYETKEKLKTTISNKVKNGTWHCSFSSTRTYKYFSKYAGCVNLMGKWELEYAKYLDDNNIIWRRPNERFYYEYHSVVNSKIGRYYTPDFYLVEEAVYIEIKGYQTEKDVAKWTWFPKEIKLKILRYEDLKNLGLLRKSNT